MRRCAAAALCCLQLLRGGRALHTSIQHEAVSSGPDQAVLPGPTGDALGKLFVDAEDEFDEAPSTLGLPVLESQLFGDAEPGDDEVFVSSFVSDSGLLCTEGPGRHVAAHLATYKASPLGGTYQESIAAFNVSCQARGYGVGRAPDACSGSGTLSLSVRKAEDVAGIAEARRGVLEHWRGRHRVNGNLSTVLAACSCHPRSEVYQARQQECESLETPGSWLHVNKVSASGTPAYLCYDGPYEYALRALATMKSTPFLVVHQADQIIPKNCSELGYGSAVGITDRCFPKLRLMTAGGAKAGGAKAGDAKARARSAQQSKALAWVSGSFFEYLADFKQLAKDKGHDYWDFGSQVNGCQCLPKSEVVKGLVSKNTTCGVPSVRDYWKG